jgi:hypothetical protein
VSLRVRTEGTQVLASVTLAPPPGSTVLATLQEGLKSEIQFELRLYRRQGGLLAWLGDRPVASIRISQVASYDPFTAQYVIRREGRVVGSFRDADAFLRRFASLRELPLGQVEPEDRGQYYALARVRLSPVRIVPPLNIITLFSSVYSVTTDWVESAIRTL